MTIRLRKTFAHGVSFELAATVFQDACLITTADLAHSEFEERWFSIGCAANGLLISLVYVWLDTNSEVLKIRLISARKATQSEIRYYQVGHE